MSVQVKHRRDTAANIAAFTPAQGELVVDTTNNRVILGDGSTVGGVALAKLSDATGVAPTRTAVADANYTALTTDRNVAFTAITAARTVTLPAASAFPVGYRLSVFDESGSASATNTITLARAGSDTIDGATSAAISSAYGVLALESNGSSKWTIIDQSASNLAAVGIGTAADPSNPLSVYGSSALFNGTNFSFTINKSAAANTAGVLFQDAFSARAQIGLLGSDNFSFKVSPNGSTYTTGLVFDATTGAPTFANQRTAVADANYTVMATDREVAYTAITAARAVTLPASSAFPAGHVLTVLDESGSVSATNTITITRAGSDTINGGTSVVLSLPYGVVTLQNSGGGKWTQVVFPVLSTANAWTAKQTFPASASGAASINLAPGSAPSSPSNGDLWTTAAGAFAEIAGLTVAPPLVIGHSRVPMVLVSSGTMGNNGALSGITAVALAFPAAYVYLPAGAISSGSAAGWYYAVFSSTSAATVYNNVYSSGTPTIPGSPTAFATTGPGAFTQTTSGVQAYAMTVPAGMIGVNGALRATLAGTNNNSSNTKNIFFKFGGTTFFGSFPTTTVSFGNMGGFTNMGSASQQAGLTPSGGTTGLSSGAIDYGTVNTASSQTAAVTLQLANAGDTITLLSTTLELLPGLQ